MKILSNIFVLVLFLIGVLFSDNIMAQSPPSTVPYVDVNRYLGKWYEIGKTPNFFQRNCLTSEADYTLISPTEMGILNTCQTKAGKTETATGVAKIVDLNSHAKLTVQFNNWFSKLFPWLTRGDYWIIDLDSDYKWVIVGHPQQKYLWILSRDPKMDEATYNALLGRAQKQGYDISKIKRSRIN